MNLRSTLFLIFLLLGKAQISQAQDQKKLDSLEDVFQNTKNDRLKLNIAGDLCWNYGTINFDKALTYGKAELDLAQKLNDSASIALAYSDLGNTYTRVNKLNEALSYHLKSYTLRDQLGLKVKAAGSISNIAVIYKQLGSYSQALEYMHRSLKIYEEVKDEAKQAIVLTNMGNVYLVYNKLDAAKENFQKAISITKRLNTPSTMANAYSGMMKYHLHENEFDEALKYGKLTEGILKELNLKADLATVYNNIGQCYFGKKDFQKAMKFYQNSLDFRLFMNDELGVGSCYKNIGDCYLQLKDFAKAEEYLKKSIVIFEQLKSKDYLREAYSLLGKASEQQKDYVTSLKFFKEGEKLKDSIYNQKSAAKINELQIAYQTEKKIQQIVLLNKENKIQKLLLAKRNVLLSIAFGALIVVILISYLLYNRYKLKQETRLQAEVLLQQDLATKAVLSAEENERKRISGDLHDGIGQMFSAVKMNLSSLTDHLNFSDDHAKMVFEKTMNLVDESCKEVRSISHQMAPNVLLKSGLAAAVRDFIGNIDARKLKINLETFGLQQRLDQNIEAVLYRVIQESVNNVIKHAKANMLDIQLTKDEEGVNVMIEDNGVGFDNAHLKTDGIGLKNIISRVEYLKGTIDFSSTPGKGTLVAIYIPL